jgi:hypothetical protein
MTGDCGAGAADKREPMGKRLVCMVALAGWGMQTLSVPLVVAPADSSEFSYGPAR